MWNPHKSIFMGLNQNFKLVCMLQSMIRIGSCCIGAFGHGQRKGHYFWKSLKQWDGLRSLLSLNFIFVCLVEMGVICNFRARPMTWKKLVLSVLQRAHGWCWCSQRHWEHVNYRFTIHNQGPSQAKYRVVGIHRVQPATLSFCSLTSVAEFAGDHIAFQQLALYYYVGTWNLGCVAVLWALPTPPNNVRL